MFNELVASREQHEKILVSSAGQYLRSFTACSSGSTGSSWFNAGS